MFLTMYCSVDKAYKIRSVDELATLFRGIHEFQKGFLISNNIHLMDVVTDYVHL